VIDKMKLAGVTDVFFHASCPDGTAAAMIVADTFAGMEWAAEFHSVQYDTDFHNKLQPGPGQLFVDITPPLKRWEEWRGFDPIVLDHHETSMPAVEGLGGVYATNESHSGAKLAYENVAVPLMGGTDEWRRFAEVAMIRDTWKKDHPLWKEACAQAYALSTFGSEKLIEQVKQGTFRHALLKDLGDVLFSANDRKAKLVASGAVHDHFSAPGGEYKMAVFNCTEKILSDAANELLDRGADVAVGFFFLHEDGVTKAAVSIRTAGRVSARKIAEHNGGGGHDRAAGFTIAQAGAVSPLAIAAVIRGSVVAVAG